MTIKCLQPLLNISWDVGDKIALMRTVGLVEILTFHLEHACYLKRSLLFFPSEGWKMTNTNVPDSLAKCPSPACPQGVDVHLPRSKDPKNPL